MAVSPTCPLRRIRYENIAFSISTDIAYGGFRQRASYAMSGTSKPLVLSPGTPMHLLCDVRY